MLTGKVSFLSPPFNKMKSLLFVCFICLVMIVIATVLYITHYEKSNSMPLSNDGNFRFMRSEFKSEIFGKIQRDRMNSVGRKDKSTSKKKSNNDERSNLDIKVLFIGVKKCGTTSLKAFARQHPDIIVENMPHVCRPRPYGSYQAIADKLEIAKTQQKVAIIENSECLHNYRYFNLLKRPEKLILLLCDPTLRTYSDYKHIVRTFGYKEPFEEIVSKAISLIKDHKDDENFGEYMSNFRYQGHLDYSIVSVGFYYEYLKEIYKQYDPENILILSGTELKQTPHSVMHQLESFLGLPPYIDQSKFVINTETGFYCIKRSVGVPQCIGVGHQKFPPPDEATVEKLKTLYHPYNEKLYQLINRTFMWI